MTADVAFSVGIYTDEARLGRNQLVGWNEEIARSYDSVLEAAKRAGAGIGMAVNGNSARDGAAAAGAFSAMNKSLTDLTAASLKQAEAISKMGNAIEKIVRDQQQWQAAAKQTATGIGKTADEAVAAWDRAQREHDANAKMMIANEKAMTRQFLAEWETQRRERESNVKMMIADEVTAWNTRVRESEANTKMIIANERAIAQATKEAADARISAWDAEQKDREATAAMILAAEKEAAAAAKAVADAKIQAWDEEQRDREATAKMIIASEQEAARAAQQAATEQEQLAASYNRLMASIDPVIAQQQKYESALAKVLDYHRSVGSSTDAMAADMDKVKASMAPVIAAEETEAQAIERLTQRIRDGKAARESQTAGIAQQTQAQNALNASITGQGAGGQVSNAGLLAANVKGLNDTAVAATNATGSVQRLTQARTADEAAAAAEIASADRLVSKYAPLLQQERQLAADKAAFTKIQQAATLSRDEEAAVMAGLTARTEALTRAQGKSGEMTKAQAAHFQSLKYQVNDVITGLISGQPVMMIFAQQGGQIVQALDGMNISLKAIPASTIAMAAGFTAAAAAAGIVAYRMAEISSEAKRLNEISGRLNPGLAVTAEQLRQISFDTAERGASRADSMAALEKVIGNTRITSATLASTITKISVDLSALKGGDVSSWAVKLSDAVGKGASAFSDMVGVVPGVTAATLEAARAAERMGDRVGALNTIFGSVENAAGGAAKKMQGAFEGAIHGISRSFDDFLESVAKNPVVIKVGVSLLNNVDQQIMNMTDLVKNPSFSGLFDILRRGSILQLADPANDRSRDQRNADFVAQAQEAVTKLRKESEESHRRMVDLESRVQQQGGAVFSASLAAERANLAALSARIESAERDLKKIEGSSPVSAAKTYTRAGTSAGVATGYNGGLADADVNKLNEQSEKLKQQAKAVTILGDAFGFSAKQAAENRVALAEMALSLGAVGAGYAETILSAASMEEAIDKLPTALRNLFHKMEDVSAARLNAELQSLTRTTMAEVEGANLLARAYGVSSEAVREAQIQQKALMEVARGAVEPYDAIVVRLRQLDDAQRKVQAAQFDATLRQQAEDAQRLAAAWGQGANAAREAALANEVLAEARKRGLSANDTSEITSISQSVLAKDAAQRAASFAQMAAEQRKAVELATAEFDMLGRSNSERAKAVAEMQAYNDLAAKGADMANAGTKAYIAQAGEIARVNSLLQDAASNAADIARPIATGLEDAIIGAKKLSDIFTGIGEDLKRIFVRLTITKPLENWASGALTQMMAGGIQPVNNNTPAPANNADALAKLVGTVQGGLGASENSAMWVRVAGGSSGAGLLGQMAQASTSQPLPVAVADAGDLNGVIEQMGAKYGIDSNLIKGIIQRESSWNPNAVNSRSGAAGLMQVMPANFAAYGITNPYDPSQNIEAGTRILKEHLVRAGGDLDKALSTYSGHVTKDGSAYVAAVKASRDAYAQATAGTRDFAGTVTVTGTRFAAVEQTAGGVTSAMEQQVAAQMDAISAANRGVVTNQKMTAAQDAVIASALGLDQSQRGVADATSQVAAKQEGVISAANGARSATEKYAQAQSQAASTTVNAASVMAQASQQAGLAMVSGAQQAMGSLISIVGSASGIKGGGIAGQVIQAGGPQGLANSFSQLSSVLNLTGAGGKSFGVLRGWLDTPISAGFGYTAPQTATVAKTATGTLAGGEGASTGLGSQAAGGTTWGDAIGAVGYGFNAFQNFSQGNVVGGIGNTAATVMSFIPGLQPFAPLVAIGSSLLGGLFGGGDKQYPMSWYDAYQGQTTGVHSLDGGDTSQLKSAGDQVQTALRQLAASLSIPVSSLPGGGFGSNPDGHPGTAAPQGDFWWSYAEGQGGWDNSRSAGSMEEAVSAYMLATLRGSDLSKVDPLAKKALNSSITDTTELSNALALAQQVASATAGLDGLAKTMDGVAASAKKAAASQYDTLKEQMTLADKADIGAEFRSLLERQLRAGFDPAVTSLSEMGTQAASITGQFDALREAVSSLGLSISETEVNAWEAAKQLQLRTSYSDTLTAAQNSAQGKDYLNSATTVAQQVAAARGNIDGLWGGNPSEQAAQWAKVVEANRAGAQKVIDDAGLLGGAFTDLTTAFSDALRKAGLAETDIASLTAGLHESTAAREAATQTQEELQKRLLEAQVGAGSATKAQIDTYVTEVGRRRELAAATDDTTRALLSQVYAAQDLATASEAAKTALEAERQVRADSASLLERAYKAVGRDYRASMTALDQQQADELRKAMAVGTTDIGLLLRTQEAEKAQAGLSALGGLLDKQIAARNAEVAAIRQTVESTKALQKSLVQAADAMALDSSVSPLSPQEVLAEAQKQWNAAVTLARGGDTDAMGRLSDLGRSYVEASKSYYASSDRTAYDDVQSVLRDFGANGTATLDAQQALVNAADDQIRQLTALKQTADAALTAQQAVPVSIAELTTAVSGGIDKLWAANQNLAGVLAGKSSPSGENAALMKAIFGQNTGSYGAPAGQKYTDANGSMSVNRFYDLAYAVGYDGSVGHGEISDRRATDSAFNARLNSALDLYWQAQSAGLIGKLPGYEDGGVVGNGLWGKDSVVARYAGGGAIALAGGEYVMPADVTAAYRPVLDAMRAGQWAVNDRWGGNVAEFRPRSAPQSQSGVADAETKAILREACTKLDILIRVAMGAGDKNIEGLREVADGVSAVAKRVSGSDRR